MTDNIFNKLAAQEEAFFASQFLAPVLKGKKIRVQIAGVIMELTVTRPKNYEGWGVFQALDPRTARRVRDPSLPERSEYLRLFPSFRVVLCRRNEEGKWFGVPAQANDSRFKIAGMVPAIFADEVQMFEVVKLAFDGSTPWFDQLDSRHPPKNAVYLRESLAAEVDPAKLELSGLTAEERTAYAYAFADLVESKKDRQEERIKAALERAGADYKSYLERGNSYTVEYVVDGQRHRSTVDKNTLEVQSAGICLSGRDKTFDLQSLVSVIREGERNRRILRVGDNFHAAMNEEQYRRVHPENDRNHEDEDEDW